LPVEFILISEAGASLQTASACVPESAGTVGASIAWSPARRRQRRGRRQGREGGRSAGCVGQPRSSVTPPRCATAWFWNSRSYQVAARVNEA